MLSQSFTFFLWCSALGGVGMLVMVSAVELCMARTRAAACTLAYVLMAGLFLFSLSGLPQWLEPRLPNDWLRYAEILLGPAMGAVSAFSQRLWLSRHRRDYWMDTGERLNGALAIGLGLACLALPRGLQLTGAAAVTVLTIGAGCWLNARSALLGDHLSWAVAWAKALMLPSSWLLYQSVTYNDMAMTPDLLVAMLCGGAGLFGQTYVLWLRNRQAVAGLRQRQHLNEQDPTTHLSSGPTLVRAMVQAQSRRRMTQTTGALLMVIVYETERLAEAVGQSGLDEIYVNLSATLQAEMPASAVLARYSRNSFAVFLESIYSEHDLYKQSLQIAGLLRQPMAVPLVCGDLAEVNLDLGVGVVAITKQTAEVDQVLYEAEHMAAASRHLRFHVAVRDPVAHTPMPADELMVSLPPVRAWSISRPVPLH